MTITKLQRISWCKTRK
ncbi:hypothetical protein PR048_020045 [Dryococelus australis]|uniref:Uncharacterized protein n=1 Tax=Dryococelus australis TaxID=614101 RepID=A0ABQ9H563_9NEOP|nr:hypothetical protein PR048_020045 [Dryococelus australis]